MLNQIPWVRYGMILLCVAQRRITTKDTIAHTHTERDSHRQTHRLTVILKHTQWIQMDSTHTHIKPDQHPIT